MRSKSDFQRDLGDAELTFRCIYVLDPRRSLFEHVLAQQKHLSLKSLFSFCVLHLHGVSLDKAGLHSEENALVQSYQQRKAQKPYVCTTAIGLRSFGCDPAKEVGFHDGHCLGPPVVPSNPSNRPSPSLPLHPLRRLPQSDVKLVQKNDFDKQPSN